MTRIQQMTPRSSTTGSSLSSNPASAAPSGPVPAGNSLSPVRWEEEIQAFEEEDRKAPPQEGAILFTGSSSIRRWHTIAEDFPDHRVINRGFGGSQIADSVAFASRTVIRYRPEMVIFYAGENDLNAGKRPGEVAADFQEFVDRVQTELPGTGIAFISMKPSPSRRHLLDAKREGNQLIREFIEERDSLSYINVFDDMLDGKSEPRAELFGDDDLHMNEQGYRLWTEIIRPHLP